MSVVISPPASVHEPPPPRLSTEDSNAAITGRRLWQRTFQVGPWRSRLVGTCQVLGLPFLIPVVRLITCDEPAEQVREIVRTIVVPVATFGLFLVVWTLLAPRHKTKSGEVPTPAVVWRAATSIWDFHVRETHKQRAFVLTGSTREAQRVAVERRLQEMVAYETAAEKQLRAAEQAESGWREKQVEPLVARRAALIAMQANRQAEDQAQLAKLAATLTTSNRAGHQDYLNAARDLRRRTQRDQAELKLLDAELATFPTKRSPDVLRAQSITTQLAEEKQYLLALGEQLGRANREVKVEAEKERVRAAQRAFLNASPDVVYQKAEELLTAEDRIQSLAASTYAKPWTLPMQIGRSVCCVFAGFLLGSALAIPLGILCGLNRSFMAAMTPFIALFRPVSPIVWLPISLIIVGGFIPDPEQHGLLQFLSSLPLVGWLKINPAFIASAVTVALCSLWATMVNTALGVASVDPDYLNVAKVLRLPLSTRLLKIIIPSAMPLMFTGLRISLGVGWMVLIAGELLSSSEGIGKFVWDQFNNGAADSFAKMMVVVFLVGLIGLLLDRLMVICQQLASWGRPVTSM